MCHNAVLSITHHKGASLENSLYRYLRLGILLVHSPENYNVRKFKNSQGVLQKATEFNTLTKLLRLIFFDFSTWYVQTMALCKTCHSQQRFLVNAEPHRTTSCDKCISHVHIRGPFSAENFFTYIYVDRAQRATSGKYYCYSAVCNFSRNNSLTSEPKI